MRRAFAGAALLGALAAPAAAGAGTTGSSGGLVLFDFFFDSTGGNVLAAVLVGLAVFLAAMFALRALNVRRIRTRVEPHVARRAEEGEEKAPRGTRERFAVLSGLFDATERALGGLGLWKKLATALERADSPLRPAEFFYVMLGSGILLALVFALFGASVLLVLVVLVVGMVPPVAVLMTKARRREQAFDDQLSDVLMTMAGSLRAGHTFRQAMQAIVEEGADPAKNEFRRVLLEVGIGRPVEQALLDMATRMRSRNFEYVISVVSIQREVGGSLAGLFDMVSETVRQRQQFARKVRALTAMGRVSAYVLTAMPFVVAALVALINPSYIKPLFTTSGGHVMIVIALVGILIGGLVLKRIVSFRMA